MIRLLAGLMLLACLVAPAFAGPDAATVNSAEFKGKPPADDRIEPVVVKAQAWLTLGEVVAVHIDKAFIQDGVYQTGLTHPIVRAGRRGDYFEIKPENMFEMIRPD